MSFNDQIVFFQPSPTELRHFNEVRGTQPYVFAPTNKSAKAVIFRNVLIPFIVMYYLVNYPHGVIIKFFLILSFLYFRIRLPRADSQTKGVRFNNVIFGHRCCEDDSVVENTFDAFNFAVERGTMGVEIDIQLTRDKHIVIFHDIMSIERLCNIPEDLLRVKGRVPNPFKYLPRKKKNKQNIEPDIHIETLKNGRVKKILTKFRKTQIRVSNLTLDELKKCEFKVPGAPTKTTTTIPTFEEFLRQYDKICHKKQPIKLMIEVKEWARPRRMAKKIRDAFVEHPLLYEHAFVASFNPILLYQMRDIDRKVVTCVCSHRNIFSDNVNIPYIGKKGVLNWLLSKGVSALLRILDNTFYYIGTAGFVLRFLEIQIVAVNKDIKEKSLRKFQKKGYQTILWTVNKDEDKKRVEGFNSGLVSDFPYNKDLDNQVEITEI